MTEMQPIYDHKPQNLIKAKPYSKNIQIPDNTHGIAIHLKDDEDHKMAHESNSKGIFKS